MLQDMCEVWKDVSWEVLLFEDVLWEVLLEDL